MPSPNNVCRKYIRPSHLVGTVFLQKPLNQSNTFNHGRPQIGIRYVTVPVEAGIELVPIALPRALD